MRILAVARFAGFALFVCYDLGLTPQALCYRLLPQASIEQRGSWIVAKRCAGRLVPGQLWSGINHCKLGQRCSFIRSKS